MVAVSPVTSIRDLSRSKSYKNLLRKWFSCKKLPLSPPESPPSVVDSKHTLQRQISFPQDVIEEENPGETSPSDLTIQSFRSWHVYLLGGGTSPEGNLFWHKSLHRCFPSISALCKNVTRKSRTSTTSSPSSPSNTNAVFGSLF